MVICNFGLQKLYNNPGYSVGITCVIDIIIRKFFPLCFKLVESFENR